MGWRGQDARDRDTPRGPPSWGSIGLVLLTAVLRALAGWWMR